MKKFVVALTMVFAFATVTLAQGTAPTTGKNTAVVKKQQPQKKKAAKKTPKKKSAKQKVPTSPGKTK